MENLQETKIALITKFKKFLQSSKTATEPRFTQSIKPAYGRAFTLAEVLITLGIIGVVAALTLPNLIANYKNKVLANQTRKMYSLISHAIQRAQADAGTVDDVTVLFDTTKTSAEVLQNFAKYFDSPRLCLSSSNKCNWYYVLYASPLYTATDGSADIAYMTLPFMVLKDNSIIRISQSDSCYKKNSSIAYNPDGTMQKDENGEPIYIIYYTTYCASIIFDVNGYALPNQYGADVFEIRVPIDGKLLKSGWENSGFTSLKSILQGGDPIYTPYKKGDKNE